jgi:hypothetical protein
MEEMVKEMRSRIKGLDTVAAARYLVVRGIPIHFALRIILDR